MVFILIVLTLAIALYFYFKDKPVTNKSTASSLTRQQERLQSLVGSGKYWGLYIDYKNETQYCDAVLSLNKKHFPINSIPALPLDDCTQRACHCTHAGLIEKRTQKNNRRNKTNDRRDTIRFEDVSDRRAHMDRRSDNYVNH
ncbi:MAG TPA: hypothetical protein EYQ65_05435 [Cycloclasticus sp.]|nr:hypothetical protein [Cycloclasticus sp.]